MTLQAGILVVILFTHKGFQRPRRKRLKKLGSRSLSWIYRTKNFLMTKKKLPFILRNLRKQWFLAYSRVTPQVLYDSLVDNNPLLSNEMTFITVSRKIHLQQLFLLLFSNVKRKKYFFQFWQSHDLICIIRLWRFHNFSHCER